ncbi:glycosyltransferase family 39 protein [Thermoflexus sp.]|uniref:glycosyltransferase family 39 protein n=1 Tax=Thermoflexus sp. TaxID=1969742 RepID=UPI0035E45AF1
MRPHDRLWRDTTICSAIILVYLLLGWFHWRFVMVPAKPDEIAHLVYIADVLRGRLWPVMDPHPKAPCPLDERFQPPLYYWLSALVLWPSPIGWPEDWVVANPFFLVGAPRGNTTPCLHFPQGTAPLMAGRIWSWLLGVLTVCGLYQGGRAWLSREGAALAALVAATLPSLLFYQTGISNIALFTPLNALVLSEMAWIWRGGHSRIRWARTLILLVLSFYTRMEAIFLLIPMALLIARSPRSAQWLWSRSGAAWSGIALALVSVLFLRNLALYGDPLARVGLIARGQPVALLFWIRMEFLDFLKGALIKPGQGEWLYGVLGISLLAGMLGWGIRILRRETPFVAGMLALHSGALLAASVLLSLRYIVGGPRYLGTAGGSWFWLWAAGWEGWGRGPWRSRAIAGAMLTMYTVSVLVILHGVLPIYVPRPATRAAAPIAWIDDGIVLHRAHIEPARARPGDVITIRLTWEARRPVAGNYAVFVHALDPQQPRILAQEDTYPFYGHYPTMLWAPERPFEEIHRIQLPADLKVPVVRLTVGLYRYETGERLPAFAPDGTRFQAGGPDAIPIGVVDLEGLSEP